MDIIFRANSLCKIYGKDKALDSFSMTIPRGAIYGFVGRNGAGKTTLIRLLCGLQYPDSGDFSLFGINNCGKAIETTRKRIGALVEKPALYLDMSARENLQQQYRFLGLQSFDGIDDLLRQVELEDTGKKKAGRFSQGMRQKLSIAIALCGSPEFLVLDEPVNGLDPQGMIELRELIKRLNQEMGITFLISSHILAELSKLATHYGFIDHGKMIKEMTAEELERQCRKAYRVAVSDVQALLSVLDRMSIEHSQVSSSEVDIFSKINFSQLAMELVKENCEIINFHEQEENLEEYFIELVGGEHEA